MIHDILLIILFVFDFALIYMIYFYNPSGTINRFLSLLIIPIMLSNIEMLLLRTVDSRLSLDIGLNMAFMGGLVFFPLFYHFSFYYPRNMMNKKLKKRIILLYLSTFLLGSALFLTYIIKLEAISNKDINQIVGFFKENPFFFSIYTLMFIYAFLLLSLTIFRFFNSLKMNLMPGEKRNILMILAGFIPTSLALIFSYFLFLPLRLGINIYLSISAFYTVYFIILLFSFGYVDRKAAARTLFTYPLTIVIIVILFNYGLTDLNMRITRMFGFESSFILLVELLVLLLLIQPIVRLLESRLIRGGSGNISSDFHRLLKESSSKVVELISLQELSDFLDDIFMDKLHINEFHLMILNDSRDKYISSGNKLDKLEFPAYGELAGKLDGYRRIMNIQQIALAWHEGDELAELIEKRIVLIAPLFEHHELIGFCLFSEPGTARAWYPSEIEELEIFLSGMPVVIARCRTHDKAIALEKKQAAIEKMAVLSEISSGIAHEIRNPLSIIAASAETLAERNLSEEEVKRFAVYIQDETERMSRLLNRILSVSATSEVRHDPVNIIDTIQRALDLVSSKLRKKNISVVFIRHSRKCIAVIDKEVLMQICLNLILNALDAMTPGMRLRVEVDYFGRSMVKILFGNQGGRIPDDIKKRIFDPFFTTKKSGSGLGLSITQRLVREANGEISLLDAEDETVFQILLPAATDFMR